MNDYNLSKVIDSKPPLTIVPSNYQEDYSNIISSANQISKYEADLATKQTNEAQSQKYLNDVLGGGGMANEYLKTTNTPEMDKQRQEMNILSQDIAGLNSQLNTGLDASLLGQGRGISTSVLQGDKAVLSRNLASQISAKTGVYNAMLGNYNRAMDEMKTYLDYKYKDEQNKIAGAKQMYEVNYNKLTSAEKKLADEQTRILDAKNKALEEKKNNETQILELSIKAAGQFAPSQLVQQAMQAKTPMEAANILGKYAGDYLKNENLKAEIARMNAETAKTRADGATVPAGADANSIELATNGLSIINNLLANNEHTEASGRSEIRKFVEAGVWGATDYTYLKSQVRTLKNMMLPLKTEADVRKFFGPQMSNSDVQNILSINTSLNEDEMSPEQIRAELNKLKTTFATLGGVEENKIQQQDILQDKIDNSDRVLQNIDKTYTPPIGVSFYGE